MKYKIEITITGDQYGVMKALSIAESTINKCIDVATTAGESLSGTFSGEGYNVTITPIKES